MRLHPVSEAVTVIALAFAATVLFYRLIAWLA